MAGHAIETRHLTRDFDGKRALDDLNLAIPKGGVHALIGSNGAGKSTLFRILLGFVTPTTGQASVLGHASNALTPAIRARIGYVNEEHTLPGWIRVEHLKRMQRSQYPNWQEDVYRLVISKFDVDTRQRVGSLSRGERAGLNLALALAQQPELLILDEPTLGLDVVAKREFLDALLFSCELQSTVVYCSHQMEEVERLADSLIVIERGRLSVQCAPEELRRRVRLFIVDTAKRDTVLEHLPDVLSSRVLGDEFHFYVHDETGTTEHKLGLLGVGEPVCADIGLDAAVRAMLSRSHVGMH